MRCKEGLREVIKMAEKAVLLDLSKCMACRGCQVACKQWNDLPAEKTTFFGGPGYQNPKDLSPQTWTLVKFFEKKENGSLIWAFRKHQCLHCSDAACIAACPVTPKAMTRDKETGIVYVDESRCIGCGACVEYCPFGVPHVDEKDEKSKKCTFCIDRIQEGLEPACVKTCPSGALIFGDRDEMLKKAKAIAKKLKMAGKNPYIYGIKELKGLHKIYVLPEGLDFYDLPKSPKVPEDIGLLEGLLKPISAATLTAAAVGLAIGYLKTVRQERVLEKEKEKC